jgi:thiol-disulfide isomerase/thioredoxin
MIRAIFAVFLTLLTLTLLAPRTARARAADDSSHDDVRLGDEDLALADGGGKAVRLRPFLGKRATFVNFWATWCEPCRKEMPRLSRLATTFHKRDVRVVGVNVDGNAPSVKSFLDASPAAYPILFGSQRTLDILGDVPALPLTILVDGDGRISRVIYGSLENITDMEIEKMIAATTSARRRR